MNYKKLGTTDIDISTICLGTMTWGEQNSQEEAFEQMDFSLENGVNFWDTAELYAVPPKLKLLVIQRRSLEIGLKKQKKEKM